MIKFVQTLYNFLIKMSLLRLLTFLISGYSIKLMPGSKATGKNVLAENLARAFRRPCYNLSFHINMDASSMIGNDTFRNGEVVFLPGPIYQSAVDGGFCILDEIKVQDSSAGHFFFQLSQLYCDPSLYPL